MEEYYYCGRRRSQVPAFGSWDWNNNDNNSLPFTQCFESATTHPHFFPYTTDRDLYVTGDLYQNDVVTPAMIVVPRATTVKLGEKEGKKQKWVVSDEFKEPPRATKMSRPTPKPVDEDLYRISPHLLCPKNRKKRGMSFLSSCLIPTCIA